MSESKQGEGGSSDIGISKRDPDPGASGGTWPDIGTEVPELSNTDLVQLRVRVIALENLVISLLSGASARQLEVAREMANFITPRPGATEHPLTIHAASTMLDLVNRAERFRS